MSKRCDLVPKAKPPRTSRGARPYVQQGALTCAPPRAWPPRRTAAPRRTWSSAGARAGAARPAPGRSAAPSAAPTTCPGSGQILRPNACAPVLPWSAGPAGPPSAAGAGCGNHEEGSRDLRRPVTGCRAAQGRPGSRPASAAPTPAPVSQDRRPARVAGLEQVLLVDRRAAVRRILDLRIGVRKPFAHKTTSSTLPTPSTSTPTATTGFATWRAASLTAAAQPCQAINH